MPNESTAGNKQVNNLGKLPVKGVIMATWQTKGKKRQSYSKPNHKGKAMWQRRIHMDMSDYRLLADGSSFRLL